MSRQRQMLEEVEDPEGERMRRRRVAKVALANTGCGSEPRGLLAAGSVWLLPLTRGHPVPLGNSPLRCDYLTS